MKRTINIWGKTMKNKHRYSEEKIWWAHVTCPPLFCSLRVRSYCYFDMDQLVGNIMLSQFTPRHVFHPKFKFYQLSSAVPPRTAGLWLPCLLLQASGFRWGPRPTGHPCLLPPSLVRPNAADRLSRFQSSPPLPQSRGLERGHRRPTLWGDCKKKKKKGWLGPHSSTTF